MKDKILIAISIILSLLIVFIVIVILYDNNKDEKKDIASQIEGFWDYVKLETYYNDKKMSVDKAYANQSYIQIENSEITFYSNNSSIGQKYTFKDKNIITMCFKEYADVCEDYKIYFEDSNLIMEREYENQVYKEYYSPKGV